MEDWNDCFIVYRKSLLFTGQSFLQSRVGRISNHIRGSSEDYPCKLNHKIIKSFKQVT